jgi:hypothetical protein
MSTSKEMTMEKEHEDDDSPSSEEVEGSMRTSAEEDAYSPPESSTEEHAIDPHPVSSGVTQPVYTDSRQPGTLTRTKSATSQVITRVVSRLTTRSVKDPGPPPDGGVVAWTQAACGWICIMNTWGFVNAFGAFQTH